ncbi:MAG: hypothetical protein V4510_01060 [bacterium]
MMVRALFVAVLLVVLAGCSTPAPGPDPAPPPAPAAAPTPVHVIAPPAAKNLDWGTVKAKLSGHAGDWFVGYQDLNLSSDHLSWSAEFHASATNSTGGPVTLFAWAPSLLYSFGKDRSVQNAPFNGHVMQHSATGHASIDYVIPGAGSGLGGEDPQFVGVLFAVAADGPWNATVSFSVGDGPDVGPRFTLQGTGASIHFGGTHLAQLPTAPVGQTTLDADIATSGWTHIEVVRAPLEPDEVRDYDFKLANGYAMTGPAYGEGYFVPMVGGSAGTGALDGFGSLRDGPGKLHAALTYAETDLGAELAYCHMPLPSPMPEYLGDGNYTAFNWPFPEGLPPVANP